MEQLARLESTGMYSNIQLAEFFGVVEQTIVVMKARPEYQRIRATFATGVLDTIAEEARTGIENQVQELKEMVPASLFTLRNTLVRGNRDAATTHERRLALDAAKEILDREGTHAKVSKSEVKVKEVPDFAAQAQLHSELSFLLQAADSARAGSTNAADALDQFVQSAGDVTAQERMASQIKLEDFNPAGKPN
jgi:hypothetical protein